MIRSGLAALLALAGCGGGSSPPPPPTTTTQPPAPVVAFPIGIAGHNFVDSAGNPLTLWPSIECCWDKQATGWPGMNRTTVQEVADSGGNAVMIRLGPHSSRGPDPEAAPGTGWIAEQAEVCRFARALNVLCILSVVDCWGIRTGNNAYGWPWAVLDSAPNSEVRRWVEQSLAPFASLDNILFETGNECFAFETVGAIGFRDFDLVRHANWPGSSLPWERGIRDLIRKYAPGKFVGTNTHDSVIEKEFDFVTRHSSVYIEAPIHNKPTLVVEYQTLTPERWEQNAVRALEVGTIFGLWIGDMTPAQRQEAYSRRKRLAS